MSDIQSQMGAAPPSGNITSPSDLMMAPEQQQGGMNPGGMDALKNGIQMFLKFMSPEQLLETLLKMKSDGLDLRTGSTLRGRVATAFVKMVLLLLSIQTRHAI